MDRVNSFENSIMLGISFGNNSNNNSALSIGDNLISGLILPSISIAVIFKW
jgi:hypothetical protein